MKKYITKIKDIVIMHTQNLSDGYSQIIKICYAIINE